MTDVDSPLLSIITLVFNHDKYLRDCLDGFVMQQTDFQFEVIIHDDASTDNSRKIIEEYVERYPSIFVPIYQDQNQFSQGVKIGKAFMYPRAQGKYIALCEGDDYWTDPYKLQKQVDFLENNSDYSMCFHAANEVWEDYPEKNKLFSNLENREYTATEFFNHWIIPTASVVFRKEVIDSRFYNDNIGGNPKILFGDIALFVSCSEFGKVRGFSDIMSIYRRHSAGVTSQLIHLSVHLKYCTQSFEMASIFTSDKKLHKLILDKAIKRTLTMYWTTVLSGDQEYKSKCYDLLRSNFKNHFGLIILQSPVRFYMALRSFIRNKRLSK